MKTVGAYKSLIFVFPSQCDEEEGEKGRLPLSALSRHPGVVCRISRVLWTHYGGRDKVMKWYEHEFDLQRAGLISVKGKGNQAQFLGCTVCRLW